MRLPDIGPLSPWPTSPNAGTSWGPTSPRASTSVSSCGDGDGSVPSHWARVSKVARAVLPSPQFLARYPLHVVYTKAAFSEHIARARKNYLLVHAAPSPTAVSASPAAVSPSPGRRWLKEAPKHFYRTKETNAQDDEGRDLWKVEAVSHLPQRLGYIDITSHIYKRYGWRGFFRGLATSHCMELAHMHLSHQLYRAFDSAYLRYVDPVSETDLDREIVFWRRLHLWLRTASGRAAVLRLASNSVASIVTFPLGVVMLRQILYEPYDGQPLGFADMAKLTVVYDGPETFVSGLVPHTLVKLVVGAVAIMARGAVAAAGWDDGDEHLGVFVAEQSRVIVESLCHPLLQHIQYKQAHSLMPGLVSGEFKSIAQCYKSESPSMFLMLASNVVLLGMRIVASTHFHFLIPGNDDEH